MRCPDLATAKDAMIAAANTMVDAKRSRSRRSSLALLDGFSSMSGSIGE